MPHLPLMQWDFRDQLQATSQQVVNNGGTPETTYYVYDAGGQRVRKVTERQAAAGKRHAQGGAHLPRRLRDLPRVREQRRHGDAGARDAAHHGRQAAHRPGGDPHPGQRPCAGSNSSATSSATTSARPAWSWTTRRRSFPTRSTTPTAARRIRRCAARRRRRSGIGIRGRSGMRRVGCTTTGRGITRRGWGGG